MHTLWCRCSTPCTVSHTSIHKLDQHHASQESVYEESHSPDDNHRPKCTAQSDAQQRDIAEPGASMQQPQHQHQHSRLLQQSQAAASSNPLTSSNAPSSATGPASSVTCSDHPTPDPPQESASTSHGPSGYHGQPVSLYMPSTLGNSVRHPAGAPVGFAHGTTASHSQHDSGQHVAASHTQHGAELSVPPFQGQQQHGAAGHIWQGAQERAAPAQGQQHCGRETSGHAHRHVSHQHVESQHRPVTCSPTQESGAQALGQHPVPASPLQSLPHIPVGSSQPELAHSSSLSREERLSREQGLDMMYPGSPVQWVVYAREHHLKKKGVSQVVCMWCRLPIRSISAALCTATLMVSKWCW